MPNSGIGTLLEKVEPTEALELFVDDKFAEKASLLKPERSSGLKSKEDDDGAKVALVDPTG